MTLLSLALSLWFWKVVPASFHFLFLPDLFLTVGWFARSSASPHWASSRKQMLVITWVIWVLSLPGNSVKFWEGSGSCPVETLSRQVRSVLKNRTDICWQIILSDSRGSYFNHIFAVSRWTHYFVRFTSFDYINIALARLHDRDLWWYTLGFIQNHFT